MSRALLCACALIALVCADRAAAFLCTRAGAEGPSLAWSTRTIELRRSGEGAEVSAVDAERVALGSLASWNALACSDMELVLGERTQSRLVGFDWAAGSGSAANENILVFRNDNESDPIDAWLHQLGALAITTVTFEGNQGELLDADIEINDTGFSFTSCDPEETECLVDFDLQNTLTHELGHLLGLDHSVEAEATMFASAPRRDTSKRTLAVDDEAALCAVYPAGELAGECFGVARAEPPDVRFAATVCGAGASAPMWLALMILWAGRPRTRRAGSVSITLDDGDVGSADFPRR